MSAERLALFLPTMDDGGAERVMLHLADSFARRGHPVDLVVGIPGGPLDSQVPRSARLVDLGARRTVGALPSLARYLQREQPFALLSTLEHANLLSVWARQITRSRTRVFLREARVLQPEIGEAGLRLRVLHGLMRVFYRAADGVIAVSQSVARSLSDGIGLPPERIRTIYNPILNSALPEKAAAPLDHPWFAPGAPPVILAVGRLSPEKDYPTLLRAFARVRAKRDARLAILGEGPERGKIQELIRELALTSNALLLGYDHNPFRYMQRATIFALTSKIEGLPGAMIQAMACGCRVIATASQGGVLEILDGNPLARCAAVGDVARLAEGMIALYDGAKINPARPVYSLERFTEERTVGEYLDALGGGRPAS
jgi:glycosyltransferase involved in cell wall biosynthesis